MNNNKVTIIILKGYYFQLLITSINYNRIQCRRICLSCKILLLMKIFFFVLLLLLLCFLLSIKGVGRADRPASFLLATWNPVNLWGAQSSPLCYPLSPSCLVPWAELTRKKEVYCQALWMWMWWLFPQNWRIPLLPRKKLVRIQKAKET